MPASGPEAWGQGWTTSAAPTFCIQVAQCACVCCGGSRGGTISVESWFMLSMEWQAEAQRVTRTGPLSVLTPSLSFATQPMGKCHS